MTHFDSRPVHAEFVVDEINWDRSPHEYAVFHCQYHSTGDPYITINLTPMLSTDIVFI
jgi:hypothetical protein